MASILNVDQINNAAGTSALTIDSAGNVQIPGHVLQVVHNEATTGGFSTTSTSYVTDPDMPSATITPSSTSNKILIHAMIGMQHDASGQIENTIYRSISGGATTDLSASNTYGLAFSGGSSQQWDNTSIHWVDSPSTTSAVTYTWYSRSETGVSVTPIHGNCGISMILMEIAV